MTTRQQTGTTLVELLIALALVGLVGTTVTSTFVNQRKTVRLQEQIAGMTQQAQTALDLISREVRSAGTNPTGAVFTPVTYNAAQLEIRSDRNGNGNPNDPDEHVIYAYDAANRRITRDGGGGAQPVVENIQAFTFTYLNRNGQPTTVSSAIRQMQLTIVARTATPDSTYPSNHGYRTYRLASLITLRN